MLKRHSVLFVYVGGESPLKVSSVHGGQTATPPQKRVAERISNLKEPFVPCRRSTATWPPSSSFTRISSRPRSKFSQRQVVP